MWNRHIVVPQLNLPKILKMTHQDSLCYQLVKQARSRRQRESSRMHKGASGHQDLGQVATGGRGSIPGSPSPSIFQICVREKVRKGEGEPGDKAT